jgi:SAM-dependent methyltransferase
MHDTAEMNCKRFFRTYTKNQAGNSNYTILEIGAFSDHTGYLPRNSAPSGTKFIGADFVEGNNVDVVLTDESKLPFINESIDCIISNSCFEHAEFFWITYLEIMRILKPDGLFYMCAPSNGVFHRYPVDCWRFYPDSANALVKWGNKNGFNSILLEQYTSLKVSDIWEDYVCVFLKHKDNIFKHPNRILESEEFFEYKNGTIYPNSEFKNMIGF